MQQDYVSRYIDLRGEVFTRDLYPVGPLDRISSLQWTTYFTEPGGFELWCPVDELTKERYKPGYVLWLADDDTAMVIQSIREDYDEATGLQYCIQGYSTMGYMRNRIVWGMFTNTNRASVIAQTLVNMAVITPTDTRRVIPYVQLDPAQTVMGESVAFQRTGTRLDMALKELLEPRTLGWGLSFDPKARTHTFKVLQPSYRTRTNTAGNVPIVFSTDTEDFLQSAYFYNNADYRNVALIAGAGEGADRQLASINNETYAGFDRFELFVDARDLSDNDENLDPIDPDTYEAMLIDRGYYHMDDYPLVETFDTKLRTVGAEYVFNQDYFLGDFVTVQDKILGITLDLQITSVTRTFDAKGYTVDPVFGEPQPTLNDQIRTYSD